MLSNRVSGLAATCLAVMGMIACGTDTQPERVGAAASAIGAVGTAAGFEDDDGNLAPEAPINFDWNSFAPTTWTGTAPFRRSTKLVSGWSFLGLEDAQAVTSDSAFAGGTKQDDNCPSVITAKAPNKDDLERVYMTTKVVNGHVFLMLAWVRIPQNTTSPSAHIGFEFNKGTTACVASNPNGLVQRTAGDMLIVYDFEGGATDTPTITLRRWVTSGACEVGSNNPPCWGPATNLTALGFAEAKVNTSSVGPVTDNIGPTPPDVLGLNEFGEAGIDLTAADVFEPGACESFGKAFAVSRSSGNSGTAQMKDLVGPGNFTISNCGSVNIRKTDQSGNPLAGAEFTLFTDAAPKFPVQTSHGAEDTPLTAASCVTPPSLTCSCTSGASGNCTINNVPFGDYWAVETIVPAGFNAAPDQPVQLSQTQTTVSLTFENQAQPGTVSVHKVDDVGAPVEGAVFTLLPDKPPTGGSPGGEDTPAVGTCTTNSAGDCSFTGVTPGIYWVVETGVPDGYSPANPLFQQVTLGPGGTQGVTFVNPRKFHVIMFVCRSHDNTLYKSQAQLDGLGFIPTLSAPPAGITEAELCGLGAARFENQAVGTQPYSVNIPLNPLP